jgi:ABC-type antimicrobial peptide transport system permease subunit
MMYVPHAQMPDVWLMFAIRTRTAPDALAETLRSTLSAAVPEAPVVSIEPMSAILAQALGPQRFGTTLFAVFAWVAVFLAAAGVYGLIAYFVSCRTREIGVRVALGASTTDIVRMTAGRGIVLSAGGLVTGLAVARALSGLLSRVLFEVSPVDPATYAVVAIGFLALAAAASYVPARRALQIDPARTLNAE